VFTARYELDFLYTVSGLSPRMPGFNPRSVHVIFVADKVALGQVFLLVPCTSAFLQCSMIIFVNMLLLPEAMFFGNREAVDEKVISLRFFNLLCWEFISYIVTTGFQIAHRITTRKTKTGNCQNPQKSHLRLIIPRVTSFRLRDRVVSGWVGTGLVGRPSRITSG
jgi:hypothetical protein